jgi:hypothetical protein
MSRLIFEFAGRSLIRKSVFTPHIDFLHQPVFDTGTQIPAWRILCPRGAQIDTSFEAYNEHAKSFV